MEVKHNLNQKAVARNGDKVKKNSVELKRNLLRFLIKLIIFFLCQDIKFTEDEKICINDLKKLYLETIKLDAALQKDIYNLEKTYESHHEVVYDRRLSVLE